MQSYKDLVNRVLTFGAEREDRTGVGTLSHFDDRIRMFVGDNSFPLITTKRVHFKSVIGELLWFLRGDTNVQWLHQHGVSIWDEWADAEGNLGPIYGAQWRAWKTPWGRIDQISKLIREIKQDPYSRRHIVSAWNVADLEIMALPPCHCFFQCYVDKFDQLSMKVYQRSVDVFLGLPFNIASYALLLSILGHVTGKKTRYLTMTFGDVHIYKNHMEQVKEQLSRPCKPLPRLLPYSDDIDRIDQFGFDDFSLVGYDPHPSISAPIAI